MYWTFYFLILLNLHAQDGKSAFEQSLEQDTAVTSEESWVEIQGVRYRKYEFNRGRYYVHFAGTDSKVADMYCEPPPGAQKERLVISEPQTARRSRAFVKAFNDSCSNSRGNKKTTLHLDPSVGLMNPENSPSPKQK